MDYLAETSIYDKTTIPPRSYLLEKTMEYYEKEGKILNPNQLKNIAQSIACKTDPIYRIQYLDDLTTQIMTTTEKMIQKAELEVYVRENS